MAVTLASDTPDDTAVLAVENPPKEELEVELPAGKLVEEAKVPLLRNPVSEEFEAKLEGDVNVLLVPLGSREELPERMLPTVVVIDAGAVKVGGPEKDAVEAVVPAGRPVDNVEALSTALPSPGDWTALVATAVPVVDTGGLILHCPPCEKLDVMVFVIAPVDLSVAPASEVSVPTDWAMLLTDALLVSFVDGLLLHTPVSAVLELPDTAIELSNDADTMLV